MPFALVFIGLLLVITGAKDTYKEFGAELREDFVGSGNFTYWILSIGAVGSLGYVPELRTFSRYFMALIIISMLIANRGFFSKLGEAIASGPVTPESAGAEEKKKTAAAEEDVGVNSNPAVDAAMSGIQQMTNQALAKVQAQIQNSNAWGNFGKVLKFGKLAFGGF